jgi:hypothetical protein
LTHFQCVKCRRHVPWRKFTPCRSCTWASLTVPFCVKRGVEASISITGAVGGFYASDVPGPATASCSTWCAFSWLDRPVPGTTQAFMRIAQVVVCPCGHAFLVPLVNGLHLLYFLQLAMASTPSRAMLVCCSPRFWSLHNTALCSMAVVISTLRRGAFALASSLPIPSTILLKCGGNAPST